MNNLLLFFAFPVATVILSIVLYRIIKCPVWVALSFFSVYLILSFSVYPQSFLIYAIAYTILSYVTAIIYRFVMKIMSSGGVGLIQNNLQDSFSIIDENTDISNDFYNCIEKNSFPYRNKNVYYRNKR